MPLGVQIWDEHGNLMIDQFTRVGRIMGVVAGNTAGGSISDGNLAQGTPFASVMLLGVVNLADLAPQVSISGTTITYTSSSYPFYIIYGTY